MQRGATHIGGVARTRFVGERSPHREAGQQEDEHDQLEQLLARARKGSAVAGAGAQVFRPRRRVRARVVARSITGPRRRLAGVASAPGQPPTAREPALAASVVGRSGLRRIGAYAVHAPKLDVHVRRLRRGMGRGSKTAVAMRHERPAPLSQLAPPNALEALGGSPAECVHPEPPMRRK